MSDTLDDAPSVHAPPVAKIPMLRTARETYAFVFSNFGSVCGSTWVAAFVSAVLSDLLEPYASTVDGGVYRVPVGLVITLFDLLLLSIMAVAIGQLVLGYRSRPSYIHFSMGVPVWRMFRACLLLMVIFTAVLFLGVLVAVAVRLPIGLILLALLAAGAFVFVRYLFYLPIAAILAPDARLQRSFALSKNNFWQILALSLAILPPVFVLGLAKDGLQLAAAGDSGSFHWPTSLGDMAAMLRGLRSSTQGLLSWRTVASIGIDTIGSVIGWGLIVTAAALAYRSHYPLPDTSAEIFD